MAEQKLAAYRGKLAEFGVEPSDSTTLLGREPSGRLSAGAARLDHAQGLLQRTEWYIVLYKPLALCAQLASAPA